ncbi:hypothetical protein [Clostridium perfringens]|uniref:hypothetical protein n=1 Tax=Clostridium perfringens TaxID=1502 RepID=UPI0032DAC48C
MKKSDLKDGMIVETGEDLYLVCGDKFLSLNGYMQFKDYDENLKIKDEGFEKYNINFVYKEAGSLGLGLKNLLNSTNLLEKIWERKKEIDWSKVPFGIKVFVCDYPLSEEEIKNKCFHDDEEPYEFICYRDEIKKFIVFDREYNEVYSFKYCYFHQSVKIKEEWYKE